MSQRRVSVVIPVYRRTRELGCAIRSLVHEQDLIHEIVVVDDGSPEPVTLDVPAVLRERVRFVRLPENVGSSSARQVAVDHATGPLIAFLDSDDAWLPGKLAAQLPFFASGDEMVAAATGWQVANTRDGSGHCRIPVPAHDPIDFASGCWFCPGSTVVISRAALDRCGPLDPQLRRLEDLDWFLRFACLGGRLAVAPVIGALIRRSISRNRAAVEAASGRIDGKFARMLGDTSPVVRRLRAWLDVERAMAAYSEGAHATAAGLMLRSLLRQPRTTVQIRDWWDLSEAVLSPSDACRCLGIAAEN